MVALVTPFARDGKRGRPPFAIETMLPLHFMQQWFGRSDPATEEALHDMPLYREFAGLDNWSTRLPDESTILRFVTCQRSTSWPRKSSPSSTRCCATRA